MPNYKKETQEYHIERVREVLALNPRAGVETIRRVLEKDIENPITLHPHYILKLKKKIKGERKQRFNQALVDERLSEIQDRTEGVVSQMWRILLSPANDERARVAAAKVIIDAEHKFFEAQMNAGIFERKLGSVEVRHRHEFSIEHKTLILKVFSNYGIVKDTPIKNEPAAIDNRASATGN